ncbi:MAG TPA: SIMPL domain-containing protein [Gemmatimonadaceae bacterium]|jgi:uncharacterized protein YggE|nr:SIMPL domain-containing protein [Gemmatimonadaceae bacterium]
MHTRLVVPALSICFLSGLASAQTPAQPREPELSTSGHGETRLAPDYAYVTIGVTNQASNAVDAAAENTRRFNAILDALHAFGLADRDLLTSRYNLEQAYEYPKNQQPKVVGFTARSSIRAEVRKLADLGRVIDAAIGSGATNIGAVQFLSSNTDDARRSAMTEAVRQARLDADAMARAAGGTLGRLLSLSASPAARPFATEQDFGRLESVTVTGAAGGMLAPPAPPINPGELVVTAQVFARWQFLPGGPR